MTISKKDFIKFIHVSLTIYYGSLLSIAFHLLIDGVLQTFIEKHDDTAEYYPIRTILYGLFEIIVLCFLIYATWKNLPLLLILAILFLILLSIVIATMEIIFTILYHTAPDIRTTDIQYYLLTHKVIRLSVQLLFNLFSILATLFLYYHSKRPNKEQKDLIIAKNSVTH
ncbi:unnamed protein product [Didymodactylos carnosus]|uniref:Uncharacterized protein n=1 Tax=Didymodactylos carnosus TaxID=1234261 RepID=A0A813UUZ7_9BILA|nr:unnamed protein product [Didymodactylos carnosus]CAF0832873.1 unnamed protein product [Didymodactylos carnosus]CAF3596775.1 unnamed protein product [Didymodactylos carnosus]CAF3619947.1 unnamed protein product [Didymodactylos carnosus]